MTDRELLELAAKAAGLTDWYWSHADESIKLHGTDIGHEWPEPQQWNPLDSDGDAFKLMVQLRLGTLFPTEIGRDRVNVKGHTESLALNDPYAATRRAIVRAAAEIGKGMK